MNRFVSQKFRFFSFVCIALLLFVHGYNLNKGYLTPFTLVEEKLTFTTFIEYFFANGALRFRIPLLFIISGYIFALQDYKPFGERIKKRFRTLIIPYLIWGAVGIGITYLLQQYPLTAQAVRDSQLDQLGDNRPYNEIGWSGIIYRWLLRPPSFQLWFIRSLFFYNLLYPLFRLLVTRFPIIWFSFLFVLWLTMFSMLFFEGQGLFFFCLGIFLNKHHYPLEKKPKWFSAFLCWLFFIGIGVIKTFMAFELDDTNPETKWIMSTLHVVSVAAGIVAIWFGSDTVVKYLMNRKWFVNLTALSFIIFAFHVPLLQYFSRLLFIFWHNFQYYRLATYIVAPTVVFFLCVGFGYLFRAVAPKAYKIATGGRGF
jgi:fucose 4-O-acetylase-like acetyltransferase